MADQQITCSACGHAFSVSSTALWIICPQCGHSLDETGAHRAVSEPQAPDDPTEVDPPYDDLSQPDSPGDSDDEGDVEVTAVGTDLDTLFDDENAEDAVDVEIATALDRGPPALEVLDPEDISSSVTIDDAGAGEPLSLSDDDEEEYRADNLRAALSLPANAPPTKKSPAEAEDIVVEDDDPIGDNQTLADEQPVSGQGSPTVPYEPVGIQAKSTAPAKPIAVDPQPDPQTDPQPDLPPRPQPPLAKVSSQLGRVKLRKVPASQLQRPPKQTPPPPPKQTPPPAPPIEKKPTDPFSDPGFADGPLLDDNEGVTRIRTEGLQKATTTPLKKTPTKPPPLPPTPPQAQKLPSGEVRPPRQRTATKPPRLPRPPSASQSALSAVGTGIDLPNRPAAPIPKPFAAGSRQEALKIRDTLERGSKPEAGPDKARRPRPPSSATLAPDPLDPPPAVVPDLRPSSMGSTTRHQRQAALSSAIEEEVTRVPVPDRLELSTMQGMRAPVVGHIDLDNEQNTAMLTEGTPAPYASDLRTHPSIEVFIPDAPIEERSKGRKARPTSSAPVQRLAPISRQPLPGTGVGVAVRPGARQRKQSKRIAIIVTVSLALAGLAIIAATSF